MKGEEEEEAKKGLDVRFPFIGLTSVKFWT